MEKRERSSGFGRRFLPAPGEVRERGTKSSFLFQNIFYILLFIVGCCCLFHEDKACLLDKEGKEDGRGQRSPRSNRPQHTYLLKIGSFIPSSLLPPAVRAPTTTTLPPPATATQPPPTAAAAESQFWWSYISTHMEHRAFARSPLLYERRKGHRCPCVPE